MSKQDASNDKQKPTQARSTDSLQKGGQAGRAWWQPALMMFGRLSGWIIAPVLIGTLLGRWLDRKYSTEPWMFIGTVGVAFVISIIGLVIEATKEYSKINRNYDEKSKEDDSNKKLN